jgi:hypothetical protein
MSRSAAPLIALSRIGWRRSLPDGGLDRDREPDRDPNPDLDPDDALVGFES